MLNRRAFLEIDGSGWKALMTSVNFAIRRRALSIFSVGRRRAVRLRGKPLNVTLSSFGIGWIGARSLRARRRTAACFRCGGRGAACPRIRCNAAAQWLVVNGGFWRQLYCAFKTCNGGRFLRAGHCLFSRLCGTAGWKSHLKHFRTETFCSLKCSFPLCQRTLYPCARG